MKIEEIYNKYRVPPNLQEHMIRVASVGVYIADTWEKPEELDRDSIVLALLFHDTGNLIKFDFKDPNLLGKEQARIHYWKSVQAEMKAKYQDEQVATIEIAKEVGLNKKAFELLLAVGSSKLKDAIETDDWNKKIVCYSDFRVDPHGFVTVNQRFDDIVTRYAGGTHNLADTEEVNRRRKLCLELEKQLQTKSSKNLNYLNKSKLQGYFTEVSERQL